MEGIELIKHNPGAPLLRVLGLGPNLKPVKAVDQLQTLFDSNTFWARGRTKKTLQKMLANSCSIVTMWKQNQLIGFGRATSDLTYRAVLWDVVIKNDYQKLGLGKILLESLINSKSIKNVEKTYLMTTNCKDFYKSCGFSELEFQTLLYKTLKI